MSMTIETSFNHHDYEMVAREVLYQGVFRMIRYSLRHRLFSGGWSEVFDREILERYSAIAVLPYDPLLDRVILIEQFRPGSLADPNSPWLIEIPAGIISKQEKPEELAFREATEETGCELTQLKPICETYVSAGGSNEYLHLFCGKVDARHVDGIHGLKNEHEDIRVINLPAEDAFKAVEDLKIKTTPALIALFWLQLNRKHLQAIWL
jgi:ADP-ribose diphosphatase